MTDTTDLGIVYVLTNPAMPGLVKIGMTTRNNVDQRMNELYGTGVPVPFDCAYACRVKVSVCDKIEKAMHTAFGPYRVNVNREFFKIDPEQAIAILKIFNLEDAVDVTAEVVKEIDDDLTPDDKTASEQLKPKRRPPLNFREMGIAPNSVLKFVDDENIQVTVSGDKKVIYDGEEMSLSAATRVIKHLDFNVQPTQYWIYGDKNLSDIYDATYPFEEEK